MEKGFFKANKFKILLTLILTFISEVVIYFFGSSDAFQPRCQTAIRECAGVNFGMDFVLYAVIPLLLFFYVFSCVVFSIKENTKKQPEKKLANLRWLYVLVLLPFLYFQKSGTRFEFGFLTYFQVVDYSGALSFEAFNLFFAILFAVVIFTIVYFIIHGIKKRVA